MRRLLAATLLAAVTVSFAPAHAEPVCQTVDTKFNAAQVCVTPPSGETVACGSVSVDPSKQTLDDVVTGYVCVSDLGDGPRPYYCVWAGRRPVLCPR